MIKIKAYFKVKELIKKEKLVMVIGPMRVGKTTIIKQLVAEDPQVNAYILADQLSKGDFKTANELISYLQFNGLLRQNQTRIFIDEAHYLPNLEIILKIFF